MFPDCNRVLVTGGAGFIGSHIVEEALKQGVDVISLDNYLAGKPENLAILKNYESIQIVNADITNYGEIEPWFNGVDVVFHNAASKKTVCLKDPARDLEINAKGTYNVLKAAKRHGVKKFVHASTGSVYGEPVYFPTDEKHPTNPTSFYGVSKLAGEKYVMLFKDDLDITVLRYHHVYGPRQDYSEYGGVVSIFAHQLLNGMPPVIHGDGTQLRSFTFVKDVVAANFFAAGHEECSGKIFNVASGIKVTINALAHKLADMIGSILGPIYDDWTIGDIRKFDIDNTRLKKLGFKYETAFDAGLRETIEDIR